MSVSSELLSHTAEVKLRVRAPSLGELAAEAGRALGALELGTTPPLAGGPWRQLEIRAPDREALLVEWLNELIYLAETERWVGVEFEVRGAEDMVLSMRARGMVVDEPPARVKADTFHGLKIKATQQGLEADVVFDV
jgi:SHS2 domain-containing protein